MNQQARQFIQQALNDPAWLFYHFDLYQDRADFVRVNEDDYRRAAFLDRRLGLRNPKQVALPLSTLQSVYDRWSPPPRPGHFIFHVGHCGSTLLSRLLGEMETVFAIREPLPLGILSMALRDQGNTTSRLPPRDYARLEELVLHLLKRVFRPGHMPVIKATSVCGNLAHRVLQDRGNTRIVWMYVKLEVFLAGMLRNEVRREEINDNAEIYLQDLNRHLGTDAYRLSDLNQVQRTVATWLAKMTFFSKLMHGEFAGRCLPLDFERFLRDPEKKLVEVTDFLGIETTPERLEQHLSGSLMQTYAKDQRSPFRAEDRAQQLARSRREHADEIQSGMGWAHRQLENKPIPDPLGSYLIDSER